MKYAVIVAALAGAAAGLVVTRHTWFVWFTRSPGDDAASPARAAAPATTGHEQVRLSPQALKNLELVSKPLAATTYWKTVDVPGRVVDRPGVSDRGVVAPVTAVVTSIHHYAGDTVEPGEPLVTLRLVGESFQTSQTELFKAIQDREIAEEHLARLSAAGAATVAGVKLIELQNTIRRLDAGINAYRQDLQIRGLAGEQIDAIARGSFVSEVVVRVPPEFAARGDAPPAGPLVAFEVQQLDVELGQQVQAGERLCTLSHHQSLFIEGRAFRHELGMIQRAAESALPIHVRIVEDPESHWDTPIPPAVIHHIANTLDENSRTVSFYLPLQNQFRTYARGGRTFFLWRFRPGQRVRLEVNVERLENVFVLPATAVVREGPEYYVFRRNGELFDRKPVRVLHQTADDVVLASDGSLPAGIHVAQSGAVQLNHALKSQAGPDPSGVHVHADGSTHRH